MKKLTLWIAALSLVGCSSPVFIGDVVLTKTGFHDADILHKPVNWEIEPELATMQGLAALRVLRDNCNLTDSEKKKVDDYSETFYQLLDQVFEPKGFEYQSTVDYITKKYQMAFKENECSQLDYILTK